MGIPLGNQLETILMENAFLFTLLSLETIFLNFDHKAEDPLFHVISPPVIS